MRMTCRPLAMFPAEFTADSRPDPFTSSWSSTVALLERELSALGADSAVIELAVSEGEINLKGWPYADARPTHPGVVVSFDSDHGPLRYGTDAFGHWQSNVRAIALGLESLRRVDRYGIGKRGEQYVGWRELPSGTGDVERGRALIAEHGSLTAAYKVTHPDAGGDPDDFRAVIAARDAA